MTTVQEWIAGAEGRPPPEVRCTRCGWPYLAEGGVCAKCGTPVWPVKQEASDA